MKYFIDTEFIEYPCTIDLISIGIVCEDGRELYCISTEFDKSKADKWVEENVLSQLPSRDNTAWMSRLNICREIGMFIGNDKPEFYGYYADYDWVVFCWIFGRMIDLPKGWARYCKDLKQMLDTRGLGKDWVKENCPTPVDEHNALSDAWWNLKLFNQINRVL